MTHDDGFIYLPNPRLRSVFSVISAICFTPSASCISQTKFLYALSVSLIVFPDALSLMGAREVSSLTDIGINSMFSKTYSCDDNVTGSLTISSHLMFLLLMSSSLRLSGRIQRSCCVMSIFLSTNVFVSNKDALSHVTLPEYAGTISKPISFKSTSRCSGYLYCREYIVLITAIPHGLSTLCISSSTSSLS